MVEQAVRDKALSKACALVSSTDSPITVDIPTEMKKLHHQGVCQHVEHISGQLEFSPSAVEAKLKEFPPGSSWTFRMAKLTLEVAAGSQMQTKIPVPPVSIPT